MHKKTCVAPNRRILELDAEAGRLQERQLFAIWWLFVPERRGEATEEGEQAHTYEFPLLSVRLEFYLQTVSCLTEVPLALESLTLQYNWILRQSTDRAFRNVGGTLRHLTLTGTVKADLLQILERRVRLATFKIRQGSVNFKFFQPFLLSQSGSLEVLDLEDKGQMFSVENRSNFFLCLSKCRKLRVLRAHVNSMYVLKTKHSSLKCRI